MKKKSPAVSLYRDGHLVAEASARDKSIYTGSDWKADLTDPASPERKQVLVRKKGSGYRLFLPVGCSAAFKKGISSLTLEEMILWKFVKVKNGTCIVPLDEDMSVEFTIGSGTYHLNFKAPAEVSPAAQPVICGSVPMRFRFTGPDLPDTVFTGIILLVMALQLFALNGIRKYPVPDMPEIRSLPRRISRLILEPVRTPAIVPKVAPGPTGAAPAMKTSRTAVEKPTDSEQVSGETIPGGRDAIRKKVSKVGVLGILTGRGIAGRISNSRRLAALELGTDLERSLDEVLSEVSGITVSKAGQGDGAGLGDGSGSGSGLMKIEGVMDSRGMSSPVKVSSLGTVPGTGTGTAGNTAPVKPAQMDERSTRAISRVVAAHTGAIRYAYNRELRKNPALRGKIVLRFTISPDGRVIRCSVERSSMNWKPLEGTLVNMVLKWKFPAIPKGTVTVRYPFVFFQSM